MILLRVRYRYAFLNIIFNIRPVKILQLEKRRI